MTALVPIMLVTLASVAAAGLPSTGRSPEPIATAAVGVPDAAGVDASRVGHASVHALSRRPMLGEVEIGTATLDVSAAEVEQFLRDSSVAPAVASAVREAMVNAQHGLDMVVQRMRRATTPVGRADAMVLAAKERSALESALDLAAQAALSAEGVDPTLAERWKSLRDDARRAKWLRLAASWRGAGLMLRLIADPLCGDVGVGRGMGPEQAVVSVDDTEPAPDAATSPRPSGVALLLGGDAGLRLDRLAREWPQRRRDAVVASATNDRAARGDVARLVGIELSLQRAALTAWFDALRAGIESSEPAQRAELRRCVAQLVVGDIDQERPVDALLGAARSLDARGELPPAVAELATVYAVQRAALDQRIVEAAMRSIEVQLGRRSPPRSKDEVTVTGMPVPLLSEAFDLERSWVRRIAATMGDRDDAAGPAATVLAEWAK